MNSPAPNWSPFRKMENPGQLRAPRALGSPEGLGDRLRAAAWAEIQAREGFLWAKATFADAPLDLRTAWGMLAKAEDKHLNWLLTRMQELKIDVTEVEVDDSLWRSYLSCTSAREFSFFMANAEERGRKAGERFAEALSARDPVTAQIFGQIAKEEIEHIELCTRFFPDYQPNARPNSRPSGANRELAT